MSSKPQQNVKKRSKTIKTTKKDVETKPEQEPAKKTIKPSKSGTSTITKDRFYPNKQTMYKTALKESKTKPIPEKVKKDEVNERPRTATIKKSVPKVEEEVYESDFDSYESDFEEYVSESSISTSEGSENEPEVDTNPKESLGKESLIEEEKKLDSGTYEITENPVKHVQVLSNITESKNENLSTLTSLSDEGFDEIKNEKLPLINFSEAKRRNSKIKSAEIKKKRGKDLLGMIRLDTQNFTVFELRPIAYETFMKSYGNRSSIQTSVQTGDDNVDEEVSTDRIETQTIWTQFPSKLNRENFEDLEEYRKDYLGVGIEGKQITNSISKVNEKSLSEFLKKTSEIALMLIEEKFLNSCKDIENNETKLPFSDGHVTFNTNLDIFKSTRVTFATFTRNSTKILTIHNSTENLQSLICLWKISDQNSPEETFSVFGSISRCCMHFSMIFGGLKDGSISIWKSERSILNNENFIQPVFTTGIDSQHTSEIISIIPVEIREEIGEKSNTQVYSLDESGLIIIWSLFEIRHHNKPPEPDLHLTAKIALRNLHPNYPFLICSDMCVSDLDPRHLFVSTTFGTIHHLTATQLTHSKTYETSFGSKSNCLGKCPFSPSYFLSGFENGNVVLFSRDHQRVLMTMSNVKEGCGVDVLEWSVNKPCVFYAKDKGNTVHVWDLTKSDIFPVYSIGFTETIDSIKLSPGISENNEVKKSYMAIVTNSKTVTLYILNKEHGQQIKKDYEDNIRKFTNYVDRL